MGAMIKRPGTFHTRAVTAAVGLWFAGDMVHAVCLTWHAA
jgi:hypothetical protein